MASLIIDEMTRRISNFHGACFGKPNMGGGEYISFCITLDKYLVLFETHFLLIQNNDINRATCLSKLQRAVTK